MKVLHVSTSDIGGAFRSCYNLHKGLREIGIESEILVLRKYTNLDGVVGFLGRRSILKRAQQSILYRIFQIWQKWVLRNRKIQFSFARSPFDIKRHPLYYSADVVNLHWVSGFLDFPSFFENNAKPIFWTLHDQAPFSSGFHFDCYRESGFERIESENMKLKIESLKSANIQVVSPSDWLKYKSQHSEVFGKFDHHLISYSVNTKEIKRTEKIAARRELDLPLDKKTILFIADDVGDKRKGLDLLLKALSLINRSDVLILTVGSMSEFQTDTPTRSLGYLSNPDTISNAYSAADLFVIPSLEDNLPNTMLESLVCGTPVVGFNIGGIGETLIDGQNGFLAKEINAECLSDTIQQALRCAFSQISIARDSSEKYHLEVQGRNYLSLYENLISLE